MNFHKHTFYVDVYKQYITVILSDSIDKTNKYMKEDVLDDTIFAHTIYSPEKHIYIVLNFWSKYQISHGVVAHECCHAVNFIFQKIGQDIFYNDESFHYCLEFVTDKVYEFLKKKNIEL